MRSWTDTIKEMPFEVAASKLGMKSFKRRWLPCPACGEKTSGGRDKRPPVRSSIKEGRAVWTCFRCKQYGDIFDLIALSQHGCRAKELGSRFHLLRNFLDTEMTVQKYEPQVEVLQYPPRKEVNALLRAAQPISGDTAKYLQGRGIDPEKALAGVANIDFPHHKLTHVLSSSGRRIPFWPNFFSKNFPLILPKFDWHGNLMTLHGRAISDETPRKTTAPIGYDSGETFFMNFNTRKWLTDKQHIKSIWIAEGEIDYLSLAQFPEEAVIGLSSAAFNTLKLFPWKRHMKVYIATDPDKVGDQYAERIASLISPAKAIRIKPQG